LWPHKPSSPGVAGQIGERPSPHWINRGRGFPLRRHNSAVPSAHGPYLEHFMAESPPAAPRIVSLDQFRGYTILGMFVVNFLGSYAAVRALWPTLAHHHTHCSYADTIMPQFFLAVGFAYRLTFLRRRERHGAPAAYGHVIKRSLALILLGFVVHHLDGRYETWSKIEELGVSGVLENAFQRSLFQTLTHIGITTLWIMPVIAAAPLWRILYAIGSAVAFHALSEWGYYDWAMRRPGIDGGPLGFLTWTIPMIAGTLAYDAMASDALGGIRRGAPARLVPGGILLMPLGYGLSCLNRVTPPNSVSQGAPWSELLVEPPFVPPTEPVNIWTMSQRAGSVSYQTFAAGFALAV